MRRREFITLLGGRAAALRLAAHAQHPERMRRIGVIMSLAADDRQGQARLAAFVQGLQKLDWTDGRNTRIDIRSAAGDTNLARKYITQLISLAPDVVLASNGSVATVVPIVNSIRLA
jgi:putative ABC transport system substrate-binding protein